MTDGRTLLKLLRDELTLQTRHCKLLETQQRALLACDRARFCILQEEHAQILSQLEALQDIRQQKLSDAEGNAIGITDLLETLSAKEQKPIAATRDLLKQTIELVQKLTQQNQQMIQNELNYIAFSLDLFLEAGRKSNTVYSGRPNSGRVFLDRRA